MLNRGGEHRSQNRCPFIPRACSDRRWPHFGQSGFAPRERSGCLMAVAPAGISAPRLAGRSCRRPLPGARKSVARGMVDRTAGKRSALPSRAEAVGASWAGTSGGPRASKSCTSTTYRRRAYARQARTAAAPMASSAASSRDRARTLLAPRSRTTGKKPRSRRKSRSAAPAAIDARRAGMGEWGAWGGRSLLREAPHTSGRCLSPRPAGAGTGRNAHVPRGCLPAGRAPPAGPTDWGPTRSAKRFCAAW